MLRTAFELQVVRETLEGMLAPEVAASVMVEALEEGEAPPDTPAEMRRFVEGPLVDALTRRADADDARFVIERIASILGYGEEPPGPPTLLPEDEEELATQSYRAETRGSHHDPYRDEPEDGADSTREVQVPPSLLERARATLVPPKSAPAPRLTFEESDAFEARDTLQAELGFGSGFELEADSGPTRPVPIPDELSSARGGSARPRKSRGPTSRRAGERAGPVRLVVVAAGLRMSAKLVLALGEDRVKIEAAASLPAVRSLLETYAPSMILIDATEPPAVDFGHLVQLFAAMPTQVLVAVWGVESPYGAELTVQLAEAGVDHASLDRRYGADPLLDLVRSRAA